MLKYLGSGLSLQLADIGTPEATDDLLVLDGDGVVKGANRSAVVPKITVASTAPVSPATGDLWVDTT